MNYDNELKIGDIVVTMFPYSDLSECKPRPALVVGISDWHDVVLAMITSRCYGDGIGVQLPSWCYYQDARHKPAPYSEIRPTRLNTISKSIISKKIGEAPESVLQEVKAKMRSVLELG